MQTTCYSTTAAVCPPVKPNKKTVLEDWETWFGKLGSNLVDGGNPFTSLARSIASDGKVSDGVSSMASGYSIIIADSPDTAVAIAKGCPF